MSINMGLSDDQRAAMAKAVTAVLADTYASYFKTHVYHWNVTGPRFNDLHMLFEQQYTELWTATDVIAERIRALDVKAPASYAAMAAAATVAADGKAQKADVMIAAGTESMSMVPMMGNSPSLSPTIFQNTDDVERYGIAYGMGLTAEKVAQQWKVSREDQDAFAVQSHARAVAAMKAGDFAAEMTPVEVTDRSVNLESADVSTSMRTVSLDEGARPDTTMEGLARLRTVFAARGSVTAGNSSQTSDGAGALILVSEAALKRYNLKPLARFVSYASRGVPPHIMGIGPVEAIPAALKNAGPNPPLIPI